MNWNQTLRDQWEWHWENQLQARLAGLTDDEYFWSPVPGDSWNVRPRGTPGPVGQFGQGAFAIDYGYPEPSPPPFTTIAWRLGHVIVGILAARNATHFGAPPASYESWPYAGTASDAAEQLDDQLGVWLAGVRKLGEDELRTPIGDQEPYPELPMAALVLHIHRELIHHLSEVCLLRDLYQHTNGAN
jgi:hypothetical protein